MYSVYIITCTVSAKQYVGIAADLEHQWKQHKKTNGSLPYLHKAIKKYGADALAKKNLSDPQWRAEQSARVKAIWAIRKAKKEAESCL